MGLIKQEIMDATGLPEDEIKRRLVKAIDGETLKRNTRKYEAHGLDKTFGVDSWAFLTECHGSDVKNLISIVKKAK